MQLHSGEDSLVESFPHALETLEGVRRYISAFQAPLQELSPVQIHTLRACSLLVIPPPKERVPPPGGFLMDLSDLNLSGWARLGQVGPGWASLVQDVVSGLLALPPNLGSDMSLPAVALLQLLEKTTGWGYCSYCCHLGSRCICMGAYPPAPPQSWSQVVDELPGYGVTASSGATTSPSTTAAGMSGYMPPPPGLPPIDFSNWRLAPPEALASRGLPTAPPGLPGVGRSVRLRGMAKRIVGVQMAQCPGGLAQQSPTLPTLALCVPQTVPPLHQPPPGWPATPYQQVVQLPKKPTGRGVAPDAPTDKTTPVGGTSSQDCGRSNMRGRGGGGQSVSHQRGVQEKASAQPPHQEGDLPSGLMPSVPPPPAPEGTQSQRGGWPRSTLHDPMQLVAKFCSAGWKKDLEHVLWVYYKFNVASFKEAEWVRLKDQFFEYFLQYKAEALGLKERCLMDFMAYMKDHFYKATGLHLEGLRSFTGWIKQGSYYHGLVARQGHLHECPCLTGVPLPRWPQVTPSESRQESQMKSDAQTASSSRPSVGATAAPVAETPGAVALVTETPVVEAPVDETLGAEAPVVPSSIPAPMETGGAGDGRSWAEQMEAGEDEAFQRSRPAKRTRSQSRRCKPKLPLPFPLWDSEGRLTSVLQLYTHAAEQPVAHHNMAGSAIMYLHPEVLPQNARRLRNQVACMIAEYHLTGSARGPSSLSQIIPQEASALLPALKNYVPGIAFKGMRNVRVVDHAKTLRVAVWLHRLDMAEGGEALASETLEASRHRLDLLLESFLTPRTSNLTFQEVFDCVLSENRRASQQSLYHLRGRRIHDREVLDGLIKAHGELDKSDKATRKSLKKEIDQRCKSLKMLKERISYYETQLGQEPSEGNTPDDDGQFSHSAQAEMAPAPGADDAPSESATTPASDPTLAEDQTQDMEVDDDGIHPCLPSPASREDDDLLTGLPQSEATEVE